MGFNNLLVTVWALVRPLPGVDLPVPVEAAGVGQHLAALLALDHGFTIATNFTSLYSTIGMFLSRNILLSFTSSHYAL